MSTPRTTHRVALAGSSLLATLLAACTWPGVEQDPPALPSRPDTATLGQRVAQLGFQSDAAFGVCTPPHCPSVTPKTLAAAAPAPVATEAVDQEPARRDRPAPSTPPASSAAADSTETLSGPVEAPVPPVVTPPPTPRRLTLLFGSNSADLTAAHRSQLKQALNELRRVDRLVISGRTDDQGSERLNQALAVSRALAIRRHLLALAPDLPARIEIDARGRCCYVAANTDEDGRARNRRVELLYTPPGVRS
ncbi:OmpA family protein [Sphaerotilus microaerophilus]|jgi:outer membrane protein OmpA-like peptidoglycan-associated protein|uniref:OmpA-like domain-containing protein n=1 Tax=Sphaerotilus microaerophilus TaxID=2914710 RepID=A0ABM7YN51_9BURK|nr:OmpA family protein [Sphaerotilus sp. FB-5]BDI05882.1 hypothetical protein CATMQ487_28520 [Sphaerotilus sp. FB-5]